MHHRKAVILNFRVTPEIRDLLADEARSLGLSLSKLCSDRVMSRPVNLNLQATLAKILQGIQQLMTKVEMLELALIGAEAQTAAAQAKEADLRSQIKELQAGVKAKAKPAAAASTGGRRALTDEGRQRIAEGQRRRWAAKNNPEAPTTEEMDLPPAPMEA